MLKKKNKIFNNFLGFTLIELMTSITIVGIISTVFIVNYRSTEEKSKLTMAVQKVASDIRLVQSYSLGEKEFNGSFPVGGWGVNFDIATPEKYIIFADENSSKNYDNVSEKFAEILLPSGVKINSLSIPGSSANIIFLPPDPETYINGDSISEIKVYFIDRHDSQKYVFVNFLGLVDVLN